MTIDEFKKDIAPHMHKGFVAMDKDCGYFYYNTKPKIDIEEWNYNGICCGLSYIFNIEPVEDWTKSLIEVGR